MKSWAPLNDNRLVDLMGDCVEAYQNSDYAAARRYSAQALDINPNNPFALVFFELSDAWMRDFDDRTFYGVANNVFEAIETLIDACDGDESSCQLCDTALRNLGALAFAHMEKFYAEKNNSRVSAVVDALNTAYYECIMLIKDPTKVKSELYEIGMYEYIKSVAESSVNMTTSDIPSKVIEACDNRLYIRENGTKVQKINDYWDDHEEEKKKMADDAEAVLVKLDNFNAEIANMTARHEAEMRKINDEISELSAQRRRLGLFKKREKEIIDMRINDKYAEISRKEQRYNRELNTIKDEKREYEQKAEYIVNAMLNGK